MKTSRRLLLVATVAFPLAAWTAIVQAGSASAPAAATPGAARSCDSPENHQFDFWAGSWDVTGRGGQPAGTNTVTSILGGCVLQEHWRGARGMEGLSFNRYDATDHLWHQTWVDSNGSQLVLSGGLVGGRMVLVGESRDAQGGTVRDRITWTPGGDGQVRQLWEQSKDGGSTWTTVFDGSYVRQRERRGF